MGFPKLLVEGRPQRIEELHMKVQKEFNYMNHYGIWKEKTPSH